MSTCYSSDTNSILLFMISEDLFLNATSSIPNASGWSSRPSTKQHPKPSEPHLLPPQSSRPADVPCPGGRAPDPLHLHTFVELTPIPTSCPALLLMVLSSPSAFQCHQERTGCVSSWLAVNHPYPKGNQKSHKIEQFRG